VAYPEQVKSFLGIEWVFCPMLFKISPKLPVFFVRKLEKR
jgi:hypothetical protein